MSRKVHRRGDEKRRRLDRRSWLKALGVAGVAGLAGCSSNGDDPSNGSTDDGSSPGSGDGTDDGTSDGTDGGDRTISGTYRSVTSAGLETLNPLYNTEAGAGTAISYALEMGYGFKPGTEYFPQLYDLTTDDSQVWVATLRENLEFGGDYGGVTAEDFVYQIQELHMSDWAATADASYWTEDITVEATGDYEFQIELPNVNALYPETYEPLLYPIPKDLVQPYVEEEDAEGLQQDEELLNLEFAGNMGAYTLEEWNRGSGVTYSRNENYYLRDADDVSEAFSDAPYFEGLELQVVQEESSRLGALESGDTDYTLIPPNRVSRFEGMSGVDVYEIPQPYNEVLTYNMRDNGWNAGPGNLFREKSFRQGLGCAVDKERLVTGVFNDRAAVQYTWQPRWSNWYPEDDSDIMQFGSGDLYGPEAARSRIEDALSAVDEDYAYDGDALMNPDGDQVTLDLYYSAGQNTEEAMCEFIAQEFEENAGIVVELQAIDGTQFSENYWQQEVPDNPDDYEWSNGASNAGPREVTSANAWDMSVVFGLNTYPLNPTTASVFFQKDSFYNPYGYYPSWDAKGLFQQAQEAESPEEAQEAFDEIFAKVSEDQPMGMLAFPADLAGYASGIEGPEESFFSGWDFSTWYRNE